MSFVADAIIHFSIVIAWLFIMLPLFASVHRQFSPRAADAHYRFYAPHLWYLNLINVLRQTPSAKASEVAPLQRRFMIFLSFFLGLVTIVTLPFLPIAFLLCFIFLQGLAMFALSLTASDAMTRLIMIDQFFSRQALVLVVCLCCLMLPFDPFSQANEAVASQAIYYWQFLPSYGVVRRPVEFFIALIALALYTRQWLENEVPLRANLISPIEAELAGTVYVTFHISRQLEYLSIHAILVTLFLGGPLFDLTRGSIFAGLLFSARIFLLSFATLLLSKLLPHYFRERAYRIAFLWLTPIVLVIEMLRSWHG